MVAVPRGALLALLTVLASSSALLEEEPTECDLDDGSCRATGSAMLQARRSGGVTVRVEEEVVGAEEKATGGRAKGTEHEDGVVSSVQGTTTIDFAGAQLIMHDNAIKVDDDKRYRWMITIHEGCTDEDLKSFTSKMPKDGKATFHGEPDKGGICMFIMVGTLDEVKEEVLTHKWPSRPIVETDATWKVIEEVEDQNKSSLLQSDWFWSSPGNQPKSWGLDRIDATSGLDENYEPPSTHGRGVHVYVADSGVNVGHPDFQGRAVPTLEVLADSWSIGWWRFWDSRVECKATDKNCAADKSGHGTHAASTVAGKDFGVAKESIIHAVKIVRDDGTGSISWYIEALDWVLSHKNTSQKAVFTSSLALNGKSPSVEAAIDQAVRYGLTVVVAAGNDNADACNYSPSFVPSAIVVASMDKNDRRSADSNYGKCVDIFAPGSDIPSAGLGTSAGVVMSGTPMAAAHVAGGVALLIAEYPLLTPAQLAETLTTHGTKDKVSDTKGSPNILLFAGVQSWWR